jgi:hypothetical protein
MRKMQNLQYKDDMIFSRNHSDSKTQINQSVGLEEEDICSTCSDVVPLATLTIGIADHKPVVALPVLSTEGKVVSHRFIADVSEQARQIVPLFSIFQAKGQSIIKTYVLSNELRLSSKWVDDELLEVDD